jgi:hypothetical protein
MTYKFYPEKVKKAFAKGTETALTMMGIRLQAEAVINLSKKGKRDTGALVNSIGYKVLANGKTKSSNMSLNAETQDPNSVIVGTNLNYSQYIEMGSGPHRTNYKSAEFKENMAGWFRRHGIFDKGIQFLILRKIRKHGTLAAPYLRPALDKVKTQAERITALAFKTAMGGEGGAPL